ncbi:MAG: hypothetical protein ACXWJ8_06330 [Xanthobacteraceae bacterium]
MLGVDPEFGASLARLWIAAGSAALLVVLCAVAFLQPQVRLAANPALRIGFVVAGAVFGAVMTWAFLDRPILGGAAAERRALELRGQQLSSQVLIPGSPLACLDALVGESVEAACEKSLFASPATVASASAYVGAQLTLLANMTTFGQRQGIELEPMMVPLRRSLEPDRFGFVAYVLAIRDGCTAQNCKTLSLFRDANRVRTNLTTAALERYLEHYAAAWSAPEVPLAEATQAPTGSTAAAGQGSRKIVNIDFPSASSIPAVSIMNPEPTGPVLPGVAAAAAANPNPSAPAQRHARKQSSPNPNAAAPNPNATLAGQSGQPAVEPIWPEPMPQAPPALAPQTAAAPTAPPPAPATAGPVQLTPSSVNAGPGAAPRTQ